MKGRDCGWSNVIICGIFYRIQILSEERVGGTSSGEDPQALKDKLAALEEELEAAKSSLKVRKKVSEDSFSWYMVVLQKSCSLACR